MPKSANIDSEITSFREKINKIFESVENKELLEEVEWSPDIDILEDKDDIIVKADIPGMNVSEIDLTIAGNRLNIKGDRKQESDRTDENYHLIGRNYGKFRRAISLPVSINSEGVRASYKDGVLIIRLSKLEKRDFGEIKVKVE